MEPAVVRYLWPAVPARGLTAQRSTVSKHVPGPLGHQQQDPNPHNPALATAQASTGKAPRPTPHSSRLEVSLEPIEAGWAAAPQGGAWRIAPPYLAKEKRRLPIPGACTF